jgi:adenylate kinase
MIILMGVAGAGKSMQGRLLADEAGYPWLSTGELLRVLITGKRRLEMLEGKLLSDDEVIKVVDTVIGLIDNSQEFVLDGFPRTIPQADWLLEQVKMGRFKLTATFHLIASDEVVKSRLSKRGRMDDTSTAINKRFEEYEAMTLPILKHLDKLGKPIVDIDASKEPMDVHADIMKFLSAYNSEKK